MSVASQHPGHQVGDVIELDGLEQILWPDHCVQGTVGAEFCQGLNLDGVDKVIRKGTDPNIDSYSAFFDNGHRKSTGLERFLRDRGVDELHLAGLTAEFCVRFTALDARRLGFAVKVFREGVRGVERNPGDCERALAEMRAAGVEIISAGE
jgi:nicotinamidase/pyrazinamidase